MLSNTNKLFQRGRDNVKIKQMILYSDRNGRPRGYSSTDLAGILWSSIQSVILKNGLLDMMFGYVRSDWTKLSIPAGVEDLVKGKYEHEDSRVWIRRTLKVNPSFIFDAHRGQFWNERKVSTSIPDMLYADQDMLFDFIEALHAVVSTPNFDEKKFRHTSFSKLKGQELLRNAINDDLALCTTPLKLLSNGQIVTLDDGALSELAEQALDVTATGEVKQATVDTLHQSIGMYLKRGGTVSDKKTAIVELAGSLESLRPQVKMHLLSKDEGALFTIANEFAIRHQDAKQKSDYDKDIWYDYMFQVNLAAVLTVIRIIQKQSK